MGDFVVSSKFDEEVDIESGSPTVVLAVVVVVSPLLLLLLFVVVDDGTRR
jgi:hypothetical protein